MKCILRIIFLVMAMIASSSITLAAPRPIVEIETNMGKIVVELNHRRAPATVANFLKYVKKGFYDGTIFHRVMVDFMIQGGGFDVALNKKRTRRPIRNESTNGLTNSMGTIAMARTSEIDSATSQFYINVNENRSLNSKFGEHGYTVFGYVIDGMDVVQKIAAVPVEPILNIGEHVPVKPVIILSISLLETPTKQQNTIKEVK